jgi:hypothetical protein
LTKSSFLNDLIVALLGSSIDILRQLNGQATHSARSSHYENALPLFKFCYIERLLSSQYGKRQTRRFLKR